MQWDLGVQGIALLAVMAVAAGLVAQLLFGRATSPWMWAIAGTTFFVVGILVSEGLFGWATEVDLQPNVDGLSFDEVLLGGSFAAVLSVLVTRWVTHPAGQTRVARR